MCYKATRRMKAICLMWNQFRHFIAMVDEELAELGMDNVYSLTGKQFIIDVGADSNQLPNPS